MAPVGGYLAAFPRGFAGLSVKVTQVESVMTIDSLIPNAPAGRYDGIKRPYSAAQVEKLRGSFPIAYTLAERGANKLWKLLHDEPFVNTLGAMTGNQAMQQVRAGLKAI